jgi:AraC-like DNA-binding protein
MTAAVLEAREGRRRTRPASPEPRTVGGFVAAIVAALDARGVDAAAVLRRAGLDHAPTTSPMDRVPASRIGVLFEIAVEQTNDPCFGLDVAQFLRPNSLHALGFSLQASSDLRDFGKRLSRFFRFVSTSWIVSFEERHDSVSIDVSIDERAPNESEDAGVAYLVLLIRDLSRGRCNPQTIHMRRPEPATGERHRKVFGCPVRFGCPGVSLHYNPAMADVPFPGSSQELAAHNDQVVLAYLAKLDQSDVEARVKELVIKGLPSGSVSKTDIAKKMHMSARTLHNRLTRRNTSFHELLDETRQSLASAYMEDPTLSVGEIAFRLGFAEPSSFRRAYKRWTGLSPRRGT